MIWSGVHPITQGRKSFRFDICHFPVPLCLPCHRGEVLVGDQAPLRQVLTAHLDSSGEPGSRQQALGKQAWLTHRTAAS